MELPDRYINMPHLQSRRSTGKSHRLACEPEVPSGHIIPLTDMEKWGHPHSTAKDARVTLATLARGRMGLTRVI